MTSLTRLASLALFVTMLSSPVASAQSDAPRQPQKKFDHKQEIESNYDAEKDTTIVRLSLKKAHTFTLMRNNRAPAPAALADDVQIDLFFSHPGREPAAVETAYVSVYYSGEARARIEDRFRAVLDGREVLLSETVMAAQGGVRDGQKVRSLVTSVTRVDLVLIAAAEKAALILPSGEKIKLSAEQRNALADLASRMLP